VSFCIADDSYFPQLQAADVFAALCRAEAESHLLGRDYDFPELFAELTKRDQYGRLRFATLFCDESTLGPPAGEWEEEIRRLAHPE